jgi:hypothetical protein
MDLQPHNDNEKYASESKSSLDDKKNNNIDLESLLNSEYHIYSYVTADHEPGTVIVDPALSDLFGKQILFEMDQCSSVKKFKLKELLQTGLVSAGSVDLMETLTINYPNKIFSPESKPKIIGKYVHGSRKRLIGDKLNIDFEYEPKSAHKHFDFDFDDSNTNSNESESKSISLDWLKDEDNQ